MSKEKPKKPRFKLNAVVVATGPTGDEVAGCVKERTNFGLMLRVVNNDGQVGDVYIPFRTYRIDEIPGLSGLEGVVDHLHECRMLNAPEKVVAWLAPESLVFERIQQRAVEQGNLAIVVATLSRQNRERQEKALQKDQPHVLRNAALEVLNDSFRREVVARDMSESDDFREEALSQLKKESVALEIALNQQEKRSMRMRVDKYIVSAEGLLRLYSGSIDVIDHERRGFGPIDEGYPLRLSQIVLEGVCQGNRLAAARHLAQTKDDCTISSTVFALLEKAVWNQDIAAVLKPFITSIEGYDDGPRLQIASQMLEIEGCQPNKSDTAFISLVHSLKSIDGIVKLVELIRQSSKSDGLGLPPKAKITPACALQLIKEQGWYGEHQWEALLNRYRKPEDSKIHALIMAKKK